MDTIGSTLAAPVTLYHVRALQLWCLMPTTNAESPKSEITPMLCVVTAFLATTHQS